MTLARIAAVIPLVAVIGWPDSLAAQGGATPLPFSPRALEQELHKMRGKEWRFREAAARRVIEMGVAALPGLAEEHRRAADLGIPGYQSLIGATRGLVGMRHPDAVVRLVEELGHEHPNVHRTARTVLALASDECVPALEGALGSSSAQVRELAVDAIALHGKAAMASVPFLRRLLQEDPAARVRWRAARALGLLGGCEEDVTALVAGLDDPDPNTALLCAWALKRFGGTGLDGLTRALRREDLAPTLACLLCLSGEEAARRLLVEVGGSVPHDAALLAVRIFGAQERREPEFADHVLHCLEHGDEGLRIESLLALPRCMEPARVPLAPIRAALHDPSDHVRIAAVSAFRLLEGNGNSLDRDLVEAWRTGWVDARHRNAFLLKALEGLTPSAETAANILSSLEDVGQDEELQAQATMLLQQMGEIALPLVRARLTSPTTLEISTMLSGALVEMGQGGVEELLLLSAKPEPAVRLQALRHLGLPARDEERVLERFASGLRDDTERRSVLFALEWQGESGRELLRRALRSFDKLSIEERISLVRGLGKWDPDAPGLVEILGEWSARPGPRTWFVASAGALGNGEKETAARRQTLLRIIDSPGGTLGDESADVIAACLFALQKLEGSQEAVKTVARLLSHSARLVAVLAAETLGKWGPMARSALPELAGHLQDKDEFLSFSSARAITTIGATPELATTLAVSVNSSNLARANQCVRALCDMEPVSRFILPELAYAALSDDYEDVRWSTVSTKEEDPVRWRVELPAEGFHAKRSLACELLAKQALAFPEDAAEIRRILQRIMESERGPLKEVCARLLGSMEDR